jgi:hypothetical protein
MLRNVIISIGLIVALVPYLGFPQSVDTVILTTLGLTLVVFTLLARRKLKRPRSEERAVASETEVTEHTAPKVLHVERTEITDTPTVHIERVTTVDQATETAFSGEETIVEAKTTVVKRRKRKPKVTSLTMDEPSPVMQVSHEEAS